MFNVYIPETRTAPSIFGGFATPSSSLVTTTVAVTSTTSITSLTGSTSKTSPKPTFGGFTFASNPLVTPTADKPQAEAIKHTSGNMILQSLNYSM